MCLAFSQLSSGWPENLGLLNLAGVQQSSRFPALGLRKFPAPFG